MRLQSAALATAFLALAACGDDPAKPTGPITLKFAPIVYSQQAGTANDTIKGVLTIDDTLVVNVPYDSVIDFPRGSHKFSARLNIDYLPSEWTQVIDPNSSRYFLPVEPEPTCRVYVLGTQVVDAAFCTPSGQRPRNVLAARNYTRIFCPTGDFGEFCTPEPDAEYLGATWPSDSATSSRNEYISRGKLLIAATVGPELTVPAGERNIAMSLYVPGDYSPRRRLQPVTGDTNRYSNIVWTDVRHVPIWPYGRSFLDPDERPNGLFGLEVKITYYLPQQFPNTLFARFDVTNISDQADYRRVHPQVPATGFTLQNVYLTPMLDPDIGNRVGNIDEPGDDAATFFPAEGIAVAYDQNFFGRNWTAPYRSQPGLVGLKVVSTDAGAAKGVLFTEDSLLEWDERGEELNSHSVISAGRNGAALVAGCRDLNTALVCSSESPDDVRMGWSVGPIASLAPGQTRTLTIAIALAPPAGGQFTSETNLNPGNTSEASLADTNRPAYRVAGPLRDLMNQVSALTVTPAP